MKYINTKVAIPRDKYSIVCDALRKEGWNGTIIREDREYPSREPITHLFLYARGSSYITWGDDKLSFEMHEHKEIKYQEILGKEELYEIFLLNKKGLLLLLEFKPHPRILDILAGLAYVLANLDRPEAFPCSEAVG